MQTHWRLIAYESARQAVEFRRLGTLQVQDLSQRWDERETQSSPAHIPEAH
jgi:hypothetical protein